MGLRTSTDRRFGLNFQRGSRNPQTAESVQIFQGESRDPRAADLVEILNEDEGIYGPPNQFKFSKGDTRTNGRPNRSEFLEGMQGFTDRPAFTGENSYQISGPLIHALASSIIFWSKIDTFKIFVLKDPPCSCDHFHVKIMVVSERCVGGNFKKLIKHCKKLQYGFDVIL